MEFFNSIEEKSNKDNIEVLLGNIYWQRKAAEAISAQRIAEAELEAYKLADTKEGYFPLSANAKQALNNQTMYSYLKAINNVLGDMNDGYVAKQVFSGDDR